MHPPRRLHDVGALFSGEKPRPRQLLGAAFGLAALGLAGVVVALGRVACRRNC